MFIIIVVIKFGRRTDIRKDVMKISARCQYAIKAMLELANHYQEKEPLQLQEISLRQRIPRKYLVQILLQLKGANLVDSVRGKQGGYYLTVAPSHVTLGAIVRLMQGSLVEGRETGRRAGGSGRLSPEDEALQQVWRDVERSMAAILDAITFEDLKERCAAGRYTANYVI